MTAQTGTTRKPTAPREPGTGWLTAAFLLAVVVSASLLFLPLFMTSSADGDAVVPQPRNGASTGVQDVGPASATTDERQSLVEQEGWGSAAVLAVPALLCVVPLLTRGRSRRPVTIGAAVLLGGGALVSIASIGLFYLPSAVLLVVAAVKAGKPRER